MAEELCNITVNMSSDGHLYSVLPEKLKYLTRGLEFSYFEKNRMLVITMRTNRPKCVILQDFLTCLQIYSHQFFFKQRGIAENIKRT